MTLKTAIDRGVLAGYDEAFGAYAAAVGQPKVARLGRGPDVFEQVFADLAVRARVGMDEYGVPLHAFNGRDALWDLYEELLDALVYLRQAITERDVLSSGRGEAQEPREPVCPDTPGDGTA